MKILMDIIGPNLLKNKQKKYMLIMAYLMHLLAKDIYLYYLKSLFQRLGILHILLGAGYVKRVKREEK
jgi:hypothetical protein